MGIVLEVMFCTYLLKRKPNDISGAIISSAWLRLAFEPPYFKVLLGKMMNFIWPSLLKIMSLIQMV